MTVERSASVPDALRDVLVNYRRRCRTLIGKLKAEQTVIDEAAAELQALVLELEAMIDRATRAVRADGAVHNAADLARAGVVKALERIDREIINPGTRAIEERLKAAERDSRSLERRSADSSRRFGAVRDRLEQRKGECSAALSRIHQQLSNSSARTGEIVDAIDQMMHG